MRFIVLYAEEEEEEEEEEEGILFVLGSLLLFTEGGVEDEDI